MKIELRPHWVTIVSIALTMTTLPCIAGGIRDMKYDKIECCQKRIPITDVEIGGFLGGRINKNIENRLVPFDIDSFIRMVENRNYRDWFWIGEQPGKWVESAVLSSDYSRNADLKKKAEEALARYVAAQAEDGYLGITSPEVMTAHQPFRGMDPYELYFSLHGLLTAWDEWQDEDALEASKKLGGFFIDKVVPGSAEFYPLPNPVTIAGHSVHYGWEGSLLCDPMMRLYRTTGETKYLDWSKWVVGSLDRWSNCDSFSRLDEVADGTMGIHEVQPYVHAHTFHMNFLGFLQLYQVTGDKSYLRKVEGAWRDIVARQRYITGGVSVGEHYEGGHNLPNTGHVVETCATMSWMLLCEKLLELTGDPRYADAIEMLLWNHLPAAQTIDGDGNRYHTPLVGWKPLGSYTGHDCCSSSGHRIISMIPVFFYAESDDAVYVNQYGPSKATFDLGSRGKVALEQKTRFPEEGTITIKLAMDKPASFSLNLRVPSWCTAPRITVAGKEANGVVPGEYTAITREWKDGDSIEISFPMTAQWVRGEHTNRGLWALRRGPVVYCLDSVYLDEKVRSALAASGTEDKPLDGLNGVKINQSDLSSGVREQAAPDDVLGPVCEVSVKLFDGRETKAVMVPFANLGRWYIDEKRDELRNERLYPYGVWIPAAAEGSFLPVDISEAVNVNTRSGKALFTKPDASGERLDIEKTGEVNVNGVMFRIIAPAGNDGRNVLIMRGGPRDSLASGYPENVRVKIGRPALAVHVLGGVGGWAYPFTREHKLAAIMRIHYKDGTLEDWRWVDGEELTNCNSRDNVAGSKKAEGLGNVHLRTMRSSTKRDVAIESIEIIDTGSEIAPIIAAITLEIPSDK